MYQHLYYINGLFSSNIEEAKNYTNAGGIINNRKLHIPCVVWYANQQFSLSSFNKKMHAKWHQLGFYNTMRARL